jgi:RHS repeat-associated protein
LASVASNYSYDSIYELTQVLQGTTTTESYSYDPVGNRTASLGVASYTTNTSNEMTANSNASYTYDANGNTLTKVVSSNTTSYAWDYENRLASVTLPSSGGTVTFKYDPFGRRVEKISPSATSIFLYDGDNLIEEANSTGAVVARYSQGQSIDEPVAVQRATTTDYYEEDGLGSITSLTATNGAVAQSYTYDSFGNLTNSSGSLTNFFRYTGREFDTESNLYDYRARYYDPNIGRFASEDRTRFKDGINFYSYVRNRSTMLRDPSGRAAWGGGVSGSGAVSAFWFGAGVEGTFYFVGDTLGNQGILDCSGGGLGAVGGVGGSVSVTLPSIFCPNCKSICDLQGDFAGATGFAGLGLTGAVSGGVSLSKTSATFNGGGGVGVGAGAGLIGVLGNCTLIWKHHNCPSCSSSP